MVWLEFKMTSSDFVDNLIVIGSSKWWSATHHNVENDTNAPQITLFVVGADQHFRCYVVWSTVYLVHGVTIRVIRMRSAKVNDFNRSLCFCVNQNVLWFQVSVRHILRVAIRDGLKDLLRYDCSLELTELDAFRNLVEQLYAVAKFSDKENAAFVFVHLVEPHDVRMVQILKDIDFVFESDAFLLSHVQLVDNLHGAKLAC